VNVHKQASFSWSLDEGSILLSRTVTLHRLKKTLVMSMDILFDFIWDGNGTMPEK
jgi:hypothetical protein